MKVSIYNEIMVEDEEQEFFLRLVQRGNSVNLVLVEKDGTPVNGAALLQIKPNMRLYRHTCINEKLGLSLDEMGRLLLSGPAS